MPRREFLVTLWAAAVTAVAAVAGGLGLWRATPAEKTAFTEIIELDAPPPPDAPVEIPVGKFAWVNNGQGAAAISQVCPHMGCVLAWQARDGQFQCPCHGSRFDCQGDVVHGPAEHPLTYLDVTALDTEGLVVDRTKPEHRWVQIGKHIRYREFETLNTGLIVAEQAGSDAGSAYEHFDTTAQPVETYQYRLKIVKLDGSSEVYGQSEIAVLRWRPFIPVLTG